MAGGATQGWQAAPAAAPAAARPAGRAGRGGGRGAGRGGTRTRRRRDDRKQLAIQYGELWERMPPSPTAESLANEFADKEIRVLMSQNGMLINDLDPNTGRYVEKTKAQKIQSLLSVIDTLISPEALKLRADVQTRAAPAPVQRKTNMTLASIRQTSLDLGKEAPKKSRMGGGQAAEGWSLDAVADSSRLAPSGPIATDAAVDGAWAEATAPAFMHGVGDTYSVPRGAPGGVSGGADALRDDRGLRRPDGAAAWQGGATDQTHAAAAAAAGARHRSYVLQQMGSARPQQHMVAPQQVEVPPFVQQHQLRMQQLAQQQAQRHPQQPLAHGQPQARAEAGAARSQAGAARPHPTPQQMHLRDLQAQRQLQRARAGSLAEQAEVSLSDVLWTSAEDMGPGSAYANAAGGAPAATGAAAPTPAEAAQPPQDAAAQAAPESRPFVDPGISSMDSLNDAIDELFPAPGGAMYASFGSGGGPFSSADLGSLDVLPRADFVPQQPLEPARSGPEEPF